MLGERLQELRKDKKMSQYDFAKYLGVSHYTVSSYECNRSDPDDNTKKKIAELFDVSVDYLLGLIDEPVSYKRDQIILTLPRNFDQKDYDKLRLFVKYLQFRKIEEQQDNSQKPVSL